MKNIKEKIIEKLEEAKIFYLPQLMERIADQILALFSLQKQEIVKEIETEVLPAEMKATKHEGCVLDECWCYDHQEIMKEKDYPNGAIAFNRCRQQIIDNLTQLKQKLT